MQKHQCLSFKQLRSAKPNTAFTVLRRVKWLGLLYDNENRCHLQRLQQELGIVQRCCCLAQLCACTVTHLVTCLLTNLKHTWAQNKIYAMRCEGCHTIWC